MLGKAGAVLIHDMLPFFSSGTAASPVWLGKWSSPLQSPIQQPITHPHMEQPKSNQLKKMALFSDLSCTFPCTWCLLGSVALLTPWSLTSTSRDCLTWLCTRECREKHPALGPAACSQRPSLGLLPHGPPLLVTRAAQLNVHPYCGDVLYPSTSFWVCGSSASPSFLRTALQMGGTAWAVKEVGSVLMLSFPFSPTA